jgi:predicted nuclease of predicted toxin-antitoxin system
VKLLFDENVSYKLVAELASEYPESAHVRDVGLNGVDDGLIWDYAGSADFAIVSKDTDFRDRASLEGAPPKVIWLDIGNAGTAAIAALLRRDRLRIEQFVAVPDAAILVVSSLPTAL